MAPDADNPTLLQVLVLERVDRAKNMARFYVLSIEPTLFEDLALVRRWGRIGSAGRERIDLHPSRRGRSDRAREMARSQEAPRIPTPSLTAGDRLQDAGSSRHGGAPRKAGNSYRRLTRDDPLSHTEIGQMRGIRREPKGLAEWPCHDPVLPFPMIARRQNHAEFVLKNSLASPARL